MRPSLSAQFTHESGSHNESFNWTLGCLWAGKIRASSVAARVRLDVRQQADKMDYPGEKLLLRLWETLAEKGIGSLFAPWQERRMSRARIEIRRNELLTLAQTERDAESIRAGRLTYEDGQVIPSPDHYGRSLPDRGVETVPSDVELAQEVRRIQLIDEIRKEANLAKAIAVAEEVLERDEQEPPDSVVDEDWLYSWRDYAGRVSSEELQDLWGRVLAGEVKSPGSYSLRTLQFLKGISKHEAELISKVAKFVINGTIVVKKDQFFEREGITFSDLLFLQELGVLSGVEAHRMETQYKSMSDKKYIQCLVAGNKAILLEGDNPDYIVTLPVYVVTLIGKQILKLASFSVDPDYLESVGKDLASDQIQVQIADWIQVTENSGRYENERSIDA